MTTRAQDPGWTEALAAAAFCLDDFLELWAAARDDKAFELVARRHVARFEALRLRLDGFAYHSSADRRQLMTEDERTAADEATRVLGGDR